MQNFCNATNLYIQHLWKDCTQMELDDLFGSFGVILKSRVDDGIGFVKFDNHKSAAKAIEALNNVKPNIRCPKKLVVSYAANNYAINNNHEQHRFNTKNVYLRNLPINFIKKDIIALCKPFGKITSIFFENGHDYAFIRYKKSDSAFKAIRDLSGKILQNNYKLLAKLANSDPIKKNKRRKFQNQIMENPKSKINGNQSGQKIPGIEIFDTANNNNNIAHDFLFPGMTKMQSSESSISSNSSNTSSPLISSPPPIAIDSISPLASSVENQSDDSSNSNSYSYSYSNSNSNSSSQPSCNSNLYSYQQPVQQQQQNQQRIQQPIQQQPMQLIQQRIQQPIRQQSIRQQQQQPQQQNHQRINSMIPRTQLSLSSITNGVTNNTIHPNIGSYYIFDGRTPTTNEILSFRFPLNVIYITNNNQ